MDALFSDYEAIRRSGLFDPEYYLATYPDVADRNLDPLVHYLEEGGQQGRNPHPDFDSLFYLEQCRERGEQPQNPLIHYLRLGMARGFKTRREAGSAEAGAARRPRTPEQAARSPILVAIEVARDRGPARRRLARLGQRLGVGQRAGRRDHGGPRRRCCSPPRLTGCRGRISRGFTRSATGSAECGFLLVFDLPRLPARAIEPLLTVRTTGDEIGQQPLQVEIPPQELDVGIAAPQDRTRTGPADRDRLPLRLGIDSAAVDAGGILEVRGWAVSQVQIEAVEVFIDGRRIGKAEFGAARDDIAAAHPDYPNSRFSGFVLRTDIGESRVRPENRYGQGHGAQRARRRCRRGSGGAPPPRLAQGGRAGARTAATIATR